MGLRVILRFMKWPIVSLLVLLTLAAPIAHAKPPLPTATQRAEALDSQAKQAFHDGQFDRAADLFMQVYDVAKSPTAVFNAARAREQAKKLAEARALLELYLKIEKNPAGLADAQTHVASIDAAIAAQAQAEAEARKKAEAAAADAARQAENTRLELERQKAEKAKADAIAAAEKARLEALRKTTDGVAILPPAGTSGEDTEKLAREVQAAVQKEAQDANVGEVVPLTDYLRAEQNRPVVGVGAQCDFRCRLEVARTLGAAYAVTTTLRQEGKDLRVRLVLWQTRDAAELAAVEVSALTLPGLSARGQRAAGDLFNGIRRFVPTALPLPAGVTLLEPVAVALTTEVPGALATVDDLDVGPTPLTLRVTAGTHRLRLTQPGFHARAGALVVTARPWKLAVTLPQQLAAEQPPVVAAPVVPVPLVAPALAPAAVAPPAVVAPAASVAAAAPPAVKAAEPKTAEEPQKPVAQVKAEDAEDTPENDKPVKPEGGKGSSGLVFGVVPQVDGSLAMMTNANQRSVLDASWGAGGFLHMSSAAEDEVPLISWVVGARYQRFLGMMAPSGTPAATPSGVSVWTGVLLPRFSGLCGSIHYNHVNVHSGRPAFDYITGQVRIMSGHGVWYYAVGADFMLKSLRPTAEYDDVQSGPLARITLEIGLNIGGTPLSK